MLEAEIDFKNKLLRTRYGNIPIQMCEARPTYVTDITVGPRTQQVIRIPVDNNYDEAIINYTELRKGVELPSAIINIKNGTALTTVTNANDHEVKISLSQPIHVEKFEVNELHYYEEDDSALNCSTTLENLKTKLNLEHLNPEEKKKILALCHEYKDIFYCDGIALSFANSIKHHIRTKDDIPIYTKNYRQPPTYKEEVNQQVNAMLEQGIIRPSSSPWSSPVHLVPKKMDKSGKQKWRMVIDYRKLNEKTINDKYPLPNIADILDKLGKSQYFSTLDLCSGFHQIELHEEDTQKTAFNTNAGHYEFKRMPFGLTNAPATFQRVMDNVLRGIQNEKCAVYLDDIIIFSTSLQEHIERLKAVFDRLRKSNFKIQLDKCEFLSKEVAYLGHIITPEGVKPNPDKIKAVLKYPIPKTPKEIKAFLGLVGYYRRFIKDFAKLTKPLTRCLKKGAKIEITEDYKVAVEKCKQILVNHPILTYPDFSKPFILTTDASNVALGAVLSQGPIGQDKPIAYASRTLSSTEQKYTTIEKELLAIIFATKYFRPYLYSRKFYIYTDHRPLVWLFNLKDPNSKLTRWRLRLQEYDYEIIYKKGIQNSNADALSRVQINIMQTEDADETNSMMVNVDDELDNVIHDLETGQDKEPEPPEQIVGTRHTNQEDEPREVIPILNEAIDNKTNQIIVKTVLAGKMQIKITKEEDRNISNVIMPQDNNEGEILEFLKEYTIPKKKYFIYFDKEAMYKKFCRVYTEHFNDEGPKLIRCTTRITTINDTEEQQQIIENYHQGKTNHRGITETLKHLQRLYYWKNMKKSVSEYINNCNLCKTNKYERNPPNIPMMLTDTSDKPFQHIHADTFTISGGNFVTLVDSFSKLGQAIRISSKNATEIANALIEYFTYYGTPDKITVDNGAEFKNETVQQLLEAHKIKAHFITPKNPQSNGMVERFHSTIIEHIRILKHNFKEPIQELMRYAIIAYNNSIHSATGLTPFEITFGHTQTRNTMDIFYDNQYYQQYVNNHKQKLQCVYERIREELLNNKKNIADKRNSNKNKQTTFQIGQTVYESKTSNNRNKTTEKFIGPYKITKLNDDNTAEITRDNKIKKIHLRQLRQPIP